MVNLEVFFFFFGFALRAFFLLFVLLWLCHRRRGLGSRVEKKSLLPVSLLLRGAP